MLLLGVVSVAVPGVSIINFAWATTTPQPLAQASGGK